MLKINEHISYLPKQTSPLSAEVFLIETKEDVYIYDVGNGKEYVNAIQKLKKNKRIVLSHFHPDHIENLKSLNDYTLFQSKNTAKYTKINEYQTEQDEEIKIFEIPSTHAKGCLGLMVDGYLLVGDSFYPNNKGLYNVNALKMQIDLLRNFPIEQVICSHHDPLVQSKSEVLEHLESIYAKRNKHESFI